VVIHKGDLRFQEVTQLAMMAFAIYGRKFTDSSKSHR